MKSRATGIGKGHGRKAHGPANAKWNGGSTSHELYDIYMDMRGRCERPTHKRYRDYDGRGINVCERWRASFWNFVEDVGQRPAGKTASGKAAWTLDRIDNDKGYGPDNFRWASWSQQAANRRATAYSGVQRGSKQIRSKLVESEVLQIRLELAGGAVQRRLAERYRVSYSTINDIKRGKLWGWLK